MVGFTNFFPTNPSLNVSGNSPVRRRSPSNFLERAREVQNSKGQLGTLGFGGENASIINEFSEVQDTATRSIFDPAAANKLRVLDAAQVAAPVSRFPDNIESYENFMKIIILKERIFETTIGKASRNKTTRSAISTLKLPLPSQLATTYSQGYKQQGIGVSGVAAAGPAAEFVNKLRAGEIGKENIEKELASTISAVTEKLGPDAAASVGLGLTDDIAALAGGLISGLPGTVGGAAVGNAISGTAGQLGFARNPHMAVLYEAPNFREFNFSWDLRPKTPKESDNIRKIIKKLKFHSAPDTSENDHLFSYPEQFVVSFTKDEYLFKTRSLVLTNVTVDYHGEGTPLYYDRGGLNGNKAPANIKLDLSFTETRVLQKADINAGM